MGKLVTVKLDSTAPPKIQDELKSYNGNIQLDLGIAFRNGQHPKVGLGSFFAKFFMMAILNFAASS